MGGGGGSLNLGAVSVDSTRTIATSIGNSNSATAGVLRLYGATVNGVPDVIVRNNSSGLITLQRSGPGGTMGVVLSDPVDNIVNIDSTGGVTISAVISGASKLTKSGSGAGALTLSGTNTYSGDTTINSGFVNIGNVPTPFGSAAGTLNWVGGGINVTADRGTSANNILNLINVTGDFELRATPSTGTRNLVFGGVLGGSAGSLTISNAAFTGPNTFDVRFTNSFTFTRPINLGALNPVDNVAQLSTFNVSTLGDQHYSGVISGNGKVRRTVSVSGTVGRTILSGDNTYSGGTILNNGEIAIGISSTGPADAPTSGALGTGNLTVGNINASLSAFGGARTLANHVILGNTSPFALVGTNDLVLSGNVDLNSIACTLQVDNTGATTLSGIIAGANGLTKTGNGTLTLSGNNTYTGATTNNAGTLLVNGSLASPSITVNAGATLGGTGTINGAVTVAAGGSVGAGTSPGILVITNGLDLGAGGTNVFELAANSTSNPGVDFDQISLTGGNLVLGGASRVLVNFISAATLPDSTNSFWQQTNTWKIIALSGGAANPGATVFAGVDSVAGTNAGTFTTSADASGVYLTFIPSAVLLPPPAVLDPNIVGAGTTSAQVSWSSVVAASYTLQYKTNLNDAVWLNLTNLTASGTNTTIVDNTSPVPNQRFYRVVSP
jgi:autotransporter-associated beta strand protein